MPGRPTYCAGSDGIAGMGGGTPSCGSPPVNRVEYLLFTRSLVLSPPSFGLSRERDVASDSPLAAVHVEFDRIASGRREEVSLWAVGICFGAEIVGRAAVVFLRRRDSPLLSDIVDVFPAVDWKNQ